LTYQKKKIQIIAENATLRINMWSTTFAGSVFLGQWTPESVGDYASGTNHVLPTYGYARMYGGVSLDSFLKYMTVQSLTEEGLRKLGPYVAAMAEVEGLEAHKRAVTLRLQDIEARQVSGMR
jgi:histidinol dehydrogenase